MFFRIRSVIINTFFKRMFVLRFPFLLFRQGKVYFLFITLIQDHLSSTWFLVFLTPSMSSCTLPFAWKSSSS